MAEAWTAHGGCEEYCRTVRGVGGQLLRLLSLGFAAVCDHLVRLCRVFDLSYIEPCEQWVSRRFQRYEDRHRTGPVGPNGWVSPNMVAGELPLPNAITPSSFGKTFNESNGGKYDDDEWLFYSEVV